MCSKSRKSVTENPWGSSRFEIRYTRSFKCGLAFNRWIQSSLKRHWTTKKKSKVIHVKSEEAPRFLSVFSILILSLTLLYISLHLPSSKSKVRLLFSSTVTIRGNEAMTVKLDNILHFIKIKRENWKWNKTLSRTNTQGTMKILSFECAFIFMVAAGGATNKPHSKIILMCTSKI